MRWMIKLVGACLLVVVGALAGWQKAAKARQKAETIQQLGRLLARIQDEIEYRATPLPELLSRLKSEHAFPLLGLEHCASLRKFPPLPELEKSQWQQLAPFFEQLGQTSGQECIQQSGYYQNLCNAWLATAREEARTANQLYTKLGMCCGMLAALMLI